MVAVLTVVLVAVVVVVHRISGDQLKGIIQHKQDQGQGPQGQQGQNEYKKNEHKKDSTDQSTENENENERGETGKGETGESEGKGGEEGESETGDGERVTGALLMVVGTLEETHQVLETISSYESRFNHKYNYDWIIITLNNILNANKPVITQLVPNVKFIDLKSLSLQRALKNPGVRNEGTDMDTFPRRFKTRNLSKYKHLTRFLVTDLFQMKQLWTEYQYYWRVPVGSELACDVDYDVFEVMKKQNLDYGWLLIHQDYQGPQPEMMKQIREFFISSGLGDAAEMPEEWTFEGCGFYPEFEIVNTEFFRSETYSKFSNFIINNDLVYYRGWREPMLKTMATSLLINPKKIKYFDLAVVDPLYGLLNCPLNPKVYTDRKCSCDPYLRQAKVDMVRNVGAFQAMHGSECMGNWLQHHEQSRPDSFTEEQGFGQLFP